MFIIPRKIVPFILSRSLRSRERGGSSSVCADRHHNIHTHHQPSIQSDSISISVSSLYETHVNYVTYPLPS